jgi:hypothetical protein
VAWLTKIRTRTGRSWTAGDSCGVTIIVHTHAIDLIASVVVVSRYDFRNTRPCTLVPIATKDLELRLRLSLVLCKWCLALLRLRV